MPDLICPPLWTPRAPPCPCRGVRLGAGLLAMCAYSAEFSTAFFGIPFAAVVANALRGDVPVIWAGVAVFGVLALLGGFIQLRRDGHGFKPGSFLWSVGVVAFVSWRLTNFPHALLGPDWPIDAFGYQFLRMVLVAWGTSNVANIALNLIELWRSRPRRVRQPVRVRRPVMPPASAVLRHSRRSIEVFEEIEADGLAADDLLAGLRSAIGRLGRAHSAPDLVEHGGALPQIPLVRDAEGNFIPMPEAETVPVKRRR